MDFTIPEEAEMIRDMMRRFVAKELRPLEMKLFSQAAAHEAGPPVLPPDVERALRAKAMQMGLWALTAPEELGGMGLDALSACLVEEELGQTFVPLSIGDVPPALYACSDAQAEAYLAPAIEGTRRPVLALREPGGHRPETWTTCAVARPDGGYDLHGVKLVAWVSEEDFYLVFALTPGVAGDAAASATCFLVDLGLHGVATRPAGGGFALHLDGCAVGAERVLGAPGGGLRLGAEYMALDMVKLGARYLGMARRLLEMSAAYARDWESFGAPLGSRPATQRMLAEMQLDVEAGALLVYRAATHLDSAAGAGADARKEAIMVRTAAAAMLQRAIDRATMIHGGPGYLDDQPMLRMYGNLVPAETLDLATEVGYAALAADLMRAD
ncbi:MAG: acyl-CoA/acyl-ACP dehydrogenase [Anaerolineae bacterium]|nr:acyl-CoA/acyl-ACP dehydrogenase [Anaerolineae bacterium]